MRAAAKIDDPPLERLHKLSAAQSDASSVARLAEAMLDFEPELSALQAELDGLREGATPRQPAAAHLLQTEGKRLRPLCVMLASALGEAEASTVHRVALAAELVHQATLLHDDVLDGGDTRRGKPCARIIYGNAASIYGGDWLLVQALKQVAGLQPSSLLTTLLSSIETMVDAEVRQLEEKGRFATTREDYLRIASGKTASLFAWSLEAGGQLGGLEVEAVHALRVVGHALGLAFQIIDDLLDLVGDAETIGKTQCADLREGKLGLPLVLALEAGVTDALSLQRTAELAATDDAAGAAALVEIRQRCGNAGVLERCKQLALAHVEEALAALDELPAGTARDRLVTLVRSSVERER